MQKNSELSCNLFENQDQIIRPFGLLANSYVT